MLASAAPLSFGRPLAPDRPCDQPGKQVNHAHLGSTTQGSQLCALSPSLPWHGPVTVMPVAFGVCSGVVAAISARKSKPVRRTSLQSVPDEASVRRSRASTLEEGVFRLVDEPLTMVDAMPITFRATAAGSPQAFRIVAYGDSLTVGFCGGGRRFEPYGRTLAKEMATAGITCEVSVCGHSGHTAEQMVKDAGRARVKDTLGLYGDGLRHMLSQHTMKPDLVIIMAGTNDLGTSMGPDDIFEHIRQLHAVCHAQGIATLALPPPPSPCWKCHSAQATWTSARRKRLANLLDWWAQDMASSGAEPSVSFVDAQDLVPAGFADAEDGLWDWDGVHLGVAGYRMLGSRLADVVIRGYFQAPGDDGIAEALGTAAGIAAENSEDDMVDAPSTGLEFWRAQPSEEPKAFLGDIEDDYARGALRRDLPMRTLALLFVKAAELPSVGQEVELRLDRSADRLQNIAAVEYALACNGGVIACLPNIEGGVGIPWGGVAAAVLDLVRFGEEEALVRLRAVVNVRLVTRHPVQKSGGFMMSLLQEVAEWGANERKVGIEALEQEVAELERLVAVCGDLQFRSGFVAAGDFAAELIRERKERGLANLEGVRLLGGVQAADMDRARQLVATSHALESLLAVSTRTRFACEPQSLVPRLRRAKDFFEKVQGVLRARLALREAVEDDGAGQQR